MKMLQRIISGILVFCLMLSMVPAGVLAAEMETAAPQYTEEATFSTEETTFPTEETTVPTEEPTVPAEETAIPTEAETVPAEETAAATEETTAPAVEETLPTEAETIPAEETVAPTEETCCVSAEVYGAVVASGTSGNVSWQLDSDGTLTLSGKGAMNDYEMKYSAPWHKYGERIKRVVIQNGITNIGKLAFFNCRMDTVSIPASVNEIRDRAFDGCSLRTITIPSGVKTIGTNVFTGCKNLETIQVDSANSNFCAVNGVLLNKAKTTLIRVPPQKSGSYTVPSTVTKVGISAFYGCRNLTAITLPNGLKTVEDNAFVWCEQLTSLSFPDSVTSIGKRVASS